MSEALKNKTVLITGGSRGIGKAIALRLAKEGANIAIAAKTIAPHAKLEGTIFSAAEEIQSLGVKALPIQTDIRYQEQIEAAVTKTIQEFGGIDILINNASAIALANTENIDSKQFNLMNEINVRGTFLMSQACIPYLKQSPHAHILNLSPPLSLEPKWFGKHLGYTMSKYGMSMIVLGLADELKRYRIAVNALWPKTTIATAAVQNLLGGDKLIQMSRKPDIVADAAYVILSNPFENNTGNFYIDEEVLGKEGVTDFGEYSVVPGGRLYPDLFV